MDIQVIERKPCANTLREAEKAGLSPLQQRILANRLSNASAEDILNTINGTLGLIHHPELLADSGKAAERILRAIDNQERVAGVFDYDVDGCTSGAICAEALVSYFGLASQNYTPVIGNRFTDGYGLSPSLVEKILAMDELPHLVITADCGSSDEKNIAQLKAKGIDVIVTDHHTIPSEGIPASAYAVVNPTREDCQYPDKTIAGCAVIWLLLSFVRGYMVQRGETHTPKLSGLLDFVALGTVADCVSIASPLNRAFIRYGLQVMNTLHRPCFKVASEELNKESPFTEEDMAFKIGPRINARSRMDDPYAANYYLRARTIDDARHYYQVITNDNDNRKNIEATMKDTAIAYIEANDNPYVSVAYDDSFHEGVQGIVASRMVERYGKPAVIFSPTDDQAVLKGSGRTIESVHLYAVFNAIKEEDPGVFIKMGGHKGACGCSIHRDKFNDFVGLFAKYVERALIGDKSLRPQLKVDGSLLQLTSSLDLSVHEEIRQCGPFGQLFEAPSWREKVSIRDVSVMGKENPVHLRLKVELANGQHATAVWFNALDKAGQQPPIQPNEVAQLVFSVNENIFRGNHSLQLMVNGIVY